jgi:organic hydroperoxide reductase OsmC/OhrA
MPTLKREATIRWMARPPEGVQRLTVGSDSFTALPLDVDAHATHPLATSPGELLAAAIGSVFAFLAAEKLVKQGKQARELSVLVTLTLSGEAEDCTDMTLSSIECRLWGRVPEGEQQDLETLAHAAMKQCIETLSIQGATVTLEVVLEGT